MFLGDRPPYFNPKPWRFSKSSQVFWYQGLTKLLPFHNVNHMITKVQLLVLYNILYIVLRIHWQITCVPQLTSHSHRNLPPPAGLSGKTSGNLAEFSRINCEGFPHIYMYCIWQNQFLVDLICTTTFFPCQMCFSFVFAEFKLNAYVALRNINNADINCIASVLLFRYDDMLILALVSKSSSKQGQSDKPPILSIWYSVL